MFADLWLLMAVILVFPYTVLVTAVGIPDPISKYAFPLFAFILAAIASVFLDKIYTKRKIRRWNDAHPNDPCRELPPDNPG